MSRGILTADADDVPRHLIVNRTDTPVHLTVRPDPQDEERRLYMFSLEEVPRPTDAIASVWIMPEHYVGIPMDEPTCRYRGENPARAVFYEGTMSGRKAWIIDGFAN